jgi:DNA ligase-1
VKAKVLVRKPKPEAKEESEEESAAATSGNGKKESSPVANESPAESESEMVDEEADSEDEGVKPKAAERARETVVKTLLESKSKDPYPDWKPGEPVPYAALCTTFALIESTTKRLIILSHCSLFLRQVLRLTPEDLLPTVLLMINKLAADYAGVELGIGESLIMKAIGESTGRSLAVIKADQNEIGDLGLVAAKSRSNQPTMFKPKALTVRGVRDGLMAIATTQGSGAQTRKVAGIKKLLSAADAHSAGKGKGVDITKDKGGASEAKFIVRTLEGKMRLGLADKTVLVALAQAMVAHEAFKEGKAPTTGQLEKGEAVLKTVYRYTPIRSSSSFYFSSPTQGPFFAVSRC